MKGLNLAIILLFIRSLLIAYSSHRLVQNANIQVLENDKQLM